MNKEKIVLGSIVTLMMLLVVGCGAVKPVEPTSTPTSTPLPAATATATAKPATATPKGLTIPAGVFPLDTEASCTTDATIVGADDQGFKASGTISMRAGVFALWCPGARHAWEGTLSSMGYTFASDAAQPLRFVVNADGSYTFIGGKGIVTQPDGQDVVLP
jgi:hypothetical protein